LPSANLRSRMRMGSFTFNDFLGLAIATLLKVTHNVQNSVQRYNKNLNGVTNMQQKVHHNSGS
ncbi:MAG: hypothetical protein IJ148_03570, partial [Bacteroidaceae bacterium]|nr:hypothetical protein [Bacteroidaceae bacterium]